VGKTAAYDKNGFVYGKDLLEWMKSAQRLVGWRAGIAVFDFDWKNGFSHLEAVVRRRDYAEPVVGTNLDSVNFWWPPEKTASDLGVPTYAPNTLYNYFILGTWTCSKGAFDIAKLWS
jgi:hypothetical protein